MGLRDSKNYPIENAIHDLIARLDKTTDQREVEKILASAFSGMDKNISMVGDDYYTVLNYHLYRYILKYYGDREEKICLWRFFKNLSKDQLTWPYAEKELSLMDHLVRIYFYSGPLDDLTCIFIPVNDNEMIKDYLQWIKSYFYDVNYPTSLLWLYALDSSLSSFFPDEIIFMGRRIDTEEENIMIPDFSYADSVLLKRFSSDPGHFMSVTGRDANNEFKQIFTFLKYEYLDRCLSRTGQQDDCVCTDDYNREWEKFEEVLHFGVSDRHESGCISFSDLRSSTSFLNTYGKNVFRNCIQQPFFEQTKLISKSYSGRIDKFMGDNVMCVFLSGSVRSKDRATRERTAILNNLFALFDLCKVLIELLRREGYEDTTLGLRSGVSYGTEVLRSNLGNELVRDFTVTGETVNFAARLEHFSIHELIIHNREYFKYDIERFPQISEMVSVIGDINETNPATRGIIQNYTLYQNIISNLEQLESVRFDIRCNNSYYEMLKEHLASRGYSEMNGEKSRIYGYDEYQVKDSTLRFYYSFYNPKGFNKFEKIWIFPLNMDLLANFDIKLLK